MTTNTSTGPRSYGNWTKPKTAGLLGPSAIGTGILGARRFVGDASNLADAVRTAGANLLARGRQRLAGVQ